MVISKPLQRVGFTSRAEPVLWYLQSVDLKVKNTKVGTPEDTALQPRSHKFGTSVTTLLYFKRGLEDKQIGQPIGHQKTDVLEYRFLLETTMKM